MKEISIPIPERVCYSAETDNFYSTEDSRGMGNAFYYRWRDHKDLFPAAREEILSKGQSGVEICSNLVELERIVKKLTSHRWEIKSVVQTHTGKYVVIYQNL